MIELLMAGFVLVSLVSVVFTCYLFIGAKSENGFELKTLAETNDKPEDGKGC